MFIFYKLRYYSIYLFEHSTCRYIRLNTLNALHVHGPCFNAPYFYTQIYLPRVNGLEVVDGRAGLVASSHQVSQISVHIDRHLVPHPGVLVHVLERLLSTADVQHPVVDSKNLKWFLRA